MENKYSEFIMLNLLYNVLSQAKQQNTDKKVNSIYVQQAIDYICENYDKNIKKIGRASCRERV